MDNRPSAFPAACPAAAGIAGILSCAGLYFSFYKSFIVYHNNASFIQVLSLVLLTLVPGVLCMLAWLALRGKAVATLGS